MQYTLKTHYFFLQILCCVSKEYHCSFFGGVGVGAYMEVRINIFFFSRSGHKIKVCSKLAKSMGTPSNSMCNDGKEENRHKQTHKWVWGRHHYPAYTCSLYGNGSK